jgi:hypothetical protein
LHDRVHVRAGVVHRLVQRQLGRRERGWGRVGVDGDAQHVLRPRLVEPAERALDEELVAARQPRRDLTLVEVVVPAL